MKRRFGRNFSESMLLPHEILGVSPDADLPTIKRAFRALAKQHHPDRNLDPSADARFRDLMNAYRSLAHGAHRAQTSRGSTEPSGPTATWAAAAVDLDEDLSWEHRGSASLAAAYPARLARLVVLGTVGAVALLWVSAFLSHL